MPRKTLEVRIVDSPKSFLKRVSAHVPIFISVLALVVAVTGAYEARRQNRLGAMPSIHFNHLSYQSERKIGLQIENSGLGPGIISNFTILLDRKKMEKDGKPDWDGLSGQITDLFQSPGSEEYWWGGDGYVMRPGESRWVYTTPPGDVKDVRKFMELFKKRLLVKVRICSFYNECYDICSGDPTECKSAP